MSEFQPTEHEHMHTITDQYAASPSPSENEEFTSFTCKSCTLPIREGHAYELKNDRWHVKCFKCSKCSKFLGVNSNFLVLGTGALVCSDCSYSCRSCGKKIYDMAILTGDKAYCASCFKCKSCKKPIEDLRYARTSKGLFCMPCHHKLMEKKKKYEAHKAKKEANLLNALNNNNKLTNDIPSRTQNLSPPTNTTPTGLISSGPSTDSIIPISSNATNKSQTEITSQLSTTTDTTSTTTTPTNDKLFEDSSMEFNSSNELNDNDYDNNNTNGKEYSKIQYSTPDKVTKSPVNTLRSQFEINDYSEMNNDDAIGTYTNQNLTMTQKQLAGSPVRGPVDTPVLGNELNNARLDGGNYEQEELSFSPNSKSSNNNILNPSDSYKDLKDYTTPILSNEEQFSNIYHITPQEQKTPSSSHSSASPSKKLFTNLISPLKKNRSPAGKPPPVPLPYLPPLVPYEQNQIENNTDNTSNNVDINDIHNRIENDDDDAYKGLNISGLNVTEKLKLTEQENDDDDQASESTTDDTFIGHNPDDLIPNNDEFQTRSTPFRFGTGSTPGSPVSEKNPANHSRIASNASASSVIRSQLLQQNQNDTVIQQQQQHQQQQHQQQQQQQHEQYQQSVQQQPVQQSPSHKQSSSNGGIGRSFSIRKNIFGRHKRNASSAGGQPGVFPNTQNPGQADVSSDSISTQHNRSQSINESANSSRKPSVSHYRTVSDQSTIAFKTPELPMYSNFEAETIRNGGNNADSMNYRTLNPSSNNNNVLNSPPSMMNNRSQPHSRTASAQLSPFMHSKSGSYSGEPAIHENATYYEQQLRILKSDVISIKASKTMLLRDIEGLNTQKKLLEMDIVERLKKLKEVELKITEREAVLMAPPSTANVNGTNQNNHPTTLPNQSTESVASANLNVSSKNSDSSQLNSSLDDLSKSQENQSQYHQYQVQQSQPQRVELVEVKPKKVGLVRRLFRGNNENGNGNTGNDGLPTSPRQSNRDNGAIVGNSYTQTMTSSPSIQSISGPMNFRAYDESSNTPINANANNHNNNSSIASSTTTNNTTTTNTTTNNTSSTFTNLSSIMKSKSTNFLSRNVANNDGEASNGNGNANGYVSNGNTYSNVNNGGNVSGINGNGATGLYKMTIQQRSEYENRPIPYIITKCIEEIEKKGYQSEGIYRISGSSVYIDRIEKMFDTLKNSNNNINNDKLMNQVIDGGDINAIAGLLKRYLKKIPDSIIPRDLYEDVIEIGKSNVDKQSKVKDLKKILNNSKNLSRSNITLLIELSRHLNYISQNERYNKMNLNSLSTVFAPTLIRNDMINIEREITDVQAKTIITELILTNYQDIFNLA